MWEGQSRTEGDGSEWSVNEDWEARTRLANDILFVSTADSAIDNLRKRFEEEPVFKEVIEAMYDLDRGAELRNKSKARHRASEYVIEQGKLWRIKGGTPTRARTKVECVTKPEAKALAIRTHAEGGHWGRDAVKIALLDRICSPKLDASIIAAIKDCPKCKNFGLTHLHSLLEPITRRHPFELLVGDYLTLPKGTGGYSTLGVYLDTFSQHVWIFKHRTAGSAKTTAESLSQIFNNFIASETFMSDGGRHFNNSVVKTYCESRGCKLHIVAAYSPWINGLVEGTNKLLLHILKRLCAPNLGEDDIQQGSWDSLPATWPKHLDSAIHALNTRLLPALKFSPKELLLGLVVNTHPTPLIESTSALRTPDASLHIAYVKQQRIDGYEEAVKHAVKRKTAFDKRVLQKAPREVIFEPGQLVQVYRNDLDYTFKAERKLLPKWSVPRRIKSRLQNSYKLETLEEVPLQGEYSARRLRAFTPREGTELARKQEEFERKLKQQPVDEEVEEETANIKPQEDQNIESDDEEDQLEEEGEREEED
jgi:hypothetical protein